MASSRRQTNERFITISWKHFFFKLVEIQTFCFTLKVLDSTIRPGNVELLAILTPHNLAKFTSFTCKQVVLLFWLSKITFESLSLENNDVFKKKFEFVLICNVSFCISWQPEPSMDRQSELKSEPNSSTFSSKKGHCPLLPAN